MAWPFSAPLRIKLLMPKISGDLICILGPGGNEIM